MSLLKKFAGETVIYGLGSVLPRVLLFALTPILTRTLGEGEYGEHAVMYAFTALLLVFFTYGMETALFRFGSKDGQLNIVFSTATISLLTTTIVFGGTLLLFSDSIAQFLEQEGQERFIRWFIYITAFDALAALPFAKLRLENRPIRFAAIKILSVLINISIILFFLLLCPFLIENGFEWFASIIRRRETIRLCFYCQLGSKCIDLFHFI